MARYEEDRTRRIEFLVDDEEYARLEALAKQEGLDLGTYVRCRLLYDTADTVRGFVPPGALDPSELQRIVLQALDHAVSLAERDTVIHSALGKAACGTMPEAAAELTAFVFGPLRDAVDEKVGNETAERMLVSLAPLLQQACRHEGAALERAASGRRSSRPPSSSQPPQAAPRAGSSEPRSSGTILLVQHDARMRAQLAQQLRAHGYDVFTAPDGHVALAVTMRNRPDLILAAMAMPMVGGRQLTALLRVAFSSDAPPVMLISDEDAPQPVEGAVGVLPRSLAFDQVLVRIGEIVLPRGSPTKRG
jgi:CheY-like chemotaxis protein